MNAVPATPEALADILRHTAGQGGTVHTIGSGSKRHHGPAAADGAVSVSLRGLARVVSYEPGDMVVTAQAGTRLVDLQTTLAAQGQWLPIDPPYAEATIGGILASAASGPRRLGYGPPKDHLLGASVMGVGGEITKSGGRVVKNVTGFDMHKLHVGAFGTLAIYIEAHFKVAAKPPVTTAFVAPFPTLRDAHAYLLAVAGSALRPVALEAFAGAAANQVAGSLEMAGAPCVAVVGVEGTPGFVERHGADLRTLADKLRAAPPQALTADRTETLWRIVRDLAVPGVQVRIGARPHDLGALLEGGAGAHSAQVSVALGLARVTLPPDRAAADVRTLVASWDERARARDGYAVVEAAPLGLPDRALLFSAQSRSGPAALLRSVKDRWDPSHLLNRGRLAL